jgi:hypothetical protein
VKKARLKNKLWTGLKGAGIFSIFAPFFHILSSGITS